MILVIAAVLLVLWLPRRVRFVFRARAARRFLDSSADLDLFALRALTGQAYNIKCECREVDAAAAPGGAVTLSHDELVDRLKEQFGAKEVFDEQAPPNGDGDA